MSGFGASPVYASINVCTGQLSRAGRIASLDGVFEQHDAGRGEHVVTCQPQMRPDGRLREEASAFPQNHGDDRGFDGVDQTLGEQGPEQQTSTEQPDVLSGLPSNRLTRTDLVTDDGDGGACRRIESC